MTPPLEVDTTPAGTTRSPQAPGFTGITTHALSKNYGPVTALDAVSLHFAPGEVHAVLGQNGSGKSTLVKLLSGTVAETSGSITVDDREIRLGSTAAAAKAGIVTVFQELSVLPSLTVAENILLGRYRRSFLGTINRKDMYARAGAILDRFRIDLPLGASCSTLSLSQLQLVEIARALATEPRLLILDEATSSLDKPDAENLLRISRELAATGSSVLFVSHRMDEVFAVADTVSVITDGRLISTSTTADVTRDELLTQLSGKALQPLERLSHEHGHPRDEVALSAELPVLGGASITIHRAEIVGIAGLQGHGQKETLRAIAGADSTRGLRIRVGGKNVSRPSVDRMLGRGVAYVPEDRGTEGLLLKHSVRTNATLSALRRVSRFGFLSGRAENRLAAEIIGMLSVKTHTAAVAVDTLSGGNQQKVLIGRALLTEPKVVLLDDPTRGIDAGAKADIYAVLRRLADSGVGVVFNSTELPELVGLCDRVLVFHDRTIVAELSGDDITEPTILKNMLGA
jgi:ABC-type sugar transport system ATPase subunit